MPKSPSKECSPGNRPLRMRKRAVLTPEQREIVRCLKLGKSVSNTAKVTGKTEGVVAKIKARLPAPDYAIQMME